MSSSQTLSSSSDALADTYAALLDIPCDVDVIVGTGTITVRDCLKLQRNSVVRLVQAAGSDLEVRIHEVVVAAGEIIVVDDLISVRIAQILPPPGGGGRP